MATAYGRDTAYSPYISPIDLEAYQRNLFLMQGNFDKNEEALQQQVNKLESVELAKDADKKYYRDRLKQVVSGINSSDFGNLAFNNTLNSMTAYASQAIDDVVLAGYAGTQAGKKIDAEFDAYRLKDPGLASQTNYEYSKKDYNNWLQDNRAGVAYRGNNNYIPYTDVSKKVSDAVKNIVPGGYARISANGKYEYYKEDGEIVTDTKVKQTIDAVVLSDENTRKQIHINSWANLKNIDDKNFVEMSTKYANKAVLDYTKSAKEAETNAKRAAALGDESLMNEHMNTAKYNMKEAQQWSNWTSVPQFNNRAEVDAYRDRLTSLFGEENLKNTSADAYSYIKVKNKDIKANDAALTLKGQDETKQLAYDKMRQEQYNADRNYNLDLAKSLQKGEISSSYAAGQGMPQQQIDEINATSIRTSSESNPTSQSVEETKTSVETQTKDVMMKQLNDIASIYQTQASIDGQGFSFPIKNENAYNQYAKEVGVPVVANKKSLTVQEWKNYKAWQIEKNIASGNKEAIANTFKSDMEVLNNVSKGNSRIKLTKEQVANINKLNENKFQIDLQAEGMAIVKDPKFVDERGWIGKGVDWVKNIAYNVGYKRNELGDILNQTSATYGGYDDKLFEKYQLDKTKDVRAFTNEDFLKLEKIVNERNKNKGLLKANTDFNELKNNILAKQEASSPGSQPLRSALNKVGITTNPQTNAFESSNLPFIYDAIISSSTDNAQINRYKNMSFADFQKEVNRAGTEQNPQSFQSAKVTYDNGNAYLKLNESSDKIDLGLLSGASRFKQTVNTFTEKSNQMKDELVKSTALYQKCVNSQALPDYLNTKEVTINGRRCSLRMVPSPFQIDFNLEDIETKKTQSVGKIDLSLYENNPQGLYGSVMEVFNRYNP